MLQIVCKYRWRQSCRYKKLMDQHEKPTTPSPTTTTRSTKRQNFGKKNEIRAKGFRLNRSRKLVLKALAFPRRIFNIYVRITNKMNREGGHCEATIMDPILKEERREMKRLKEHCDMIGYVADAEYGIPTQCACGGRIVDEVACLEARDSLPGKRFFTCHEYKDDGLHFRQPWVLGVQEEILWIKRRVEAVEKVTWQVDDLNRLVKKLKEEVEKLSKRVAELETTP